MTVDYKFKVTLNLTSEEWIDNTFGGKLISLKDSGIGLIVEINLDRAICKVLFSGKIHEFNCNNLNPI